MLGALIQDARSAPFGAERALPRDRERGVVTRDMSINVVNGLILFGLRVTLIAGLAAHMTLGLVDAAVIGQGWQQFLVAFLLLDFTRYWLHRAHHRPLAVDLLHRVHHMTENLDATAGLRMHVDFIQLSLLPVVIFSRSWT